METYSTKMVKDKIPLSIISFLLKRVDLISKGTRDYLQIFKLQNIYNGIIIEHIQEVPERTWYYYMTEYKLDDESSKLFLLEEGNMRTLMFAEEY